MKLGRSSVWMSSADEPVGCLLVRVVQISGWRKYSAEFVFSLLDGGWRNHKKKNDMQQKQEQLQSLGFFSGRLCKPRQ